MKVRLLILLLLVALFTNVACNRDPEVAKRKYVEAGNRYFDNGKYNEAILLYKNALKRDMKFGEAHFRMGRTYARMNRFTEAVGSFQRAISLLPAGEMKSEAVGSITDIYLLFYGRSNERVRNHIKREIKELATELLAKEPGAYQTLRIDGYDKLLNGETSDAVKRLEEANRVKPHQPDVVLVLFQSLVDQERSDEGEKLVKELLEHRKDAIGAYDALYAHFARNNRIPEAEAVLKSKIANNPDQPIFRIQLAGHYFAAKKRPEMLEVLQHLKASKSSQAHQMVGDFFFRLREFDTAIREYQEGIAAVPEQKAVFQRRMAEALVFQEKRPEAFQLVESILKDNPKDPEALAMRASLLLQGGDPSKVQDAITDLQSILSRMRRPETFVVRFNLGRALLAKGDVEQAKLQFQESIKIRPDYLPPRLALAQVHLLSREFTNARQLADQILEIDPNNLPGALIKTSSRLGLGDFAGARSELTTILAAHPQSKDAQFQMALLNFAEKKYGDSEALLMKLVNATPPDPRGLIGMVELRAGQGRYDDAASLLRTEMQKAPQNVDLQLALVNVLVRGKKYEPAASELNQMVKRSPQNPALHARMGDVQRMIGNREAAIESYRTASKLAPKDAGPPLAIAMMLESDGRPDEAKGLYEDILKVQPNNAIALNNLAYWLAERGNDLDRALQLAQQAKQLLPKNPDVSDTLGWIYIKKGLSDSAIPIFKELVEQHPKRAAFRYHLGMALSQKGDQVGARRELEAALKLNPTRDEERGIRELLTRIG